MENVERILAVVSGKGGVGKTTFVSNMGLALTEMNETVTLVDGDFSTSNLGLQLGLFQFPVGIQDALKGRIDIESAMYTHPSGLRIIPASVSLRYLRQKLSPFRLRSALTKMEGIVMIDSPPGLGDDAFFVLKACDDIMVITNPEIPAVTDAFKVVEVAREMGKEPVGVILNRVRGKNELSREEVEEMCGTRVVDTIPDDDSVRKGLYEKVPVLKYSPYSPASVAFRRIASGMLGRDYSPPKFLRLRRMFGVG